MKPVSYKKISEGIFEFFYEDEFYNKFHKDGKENGDVGFLLKEKDYNTLFSKYEGYGTIENPNKSLNYTSIQHCNLFDGDFSSPEEIINYISKSYTSNARIIIWDCSKI